MTKIPFPDGYIRVSADLIAEWRQRLKRKPQHRLIALHWQGNPEHEHSLYSRGRSLPFHEWLGLQGNDQIEFVSIQKGQASEQLRTDQGLHFVKGQEAVSKSMDFQETAAVIANCDLVISSDSSVAHLAGAMGVPTWVALRWIPEWRWGLEGTSTAWYSSVRLFRQRFDGDWTGVVEWNELKHPTKKRNLTPKLKTCDCFRLHVFELQTILKEIDENSQQIIRIRLTPKLKFSLSDKFQRIISSDWHNSRTAKTQQIEMARISRQYGWNAASNSLHRDKISTSL